MIPRECGSEVQISRCGSLNFTITLLFLSCALAIAERKGLIIFRFELAKQVLEALRPGQSGTRK